MTTSRAMPQSPSASVADQSDALSARCVWEALVNDPAASVTLVDGDGRIHFANRNAVLRCMPVGTKPEAVVGSSLADAMSPEAFSEFIGVLRRALQGGAPMVMRHINRGLQRITTMRRVGDMVAGMRVAGPTVLMVSREIAGRVHSEELLASIPGGVYHDASFADFGPIARLSVRELEVLAMIGEGQSMPQIAKKLALSIHTVHEHRKSMGRKLNIDDRVLLALHAERAGLRTDDSVKARRPLWKVED